MEKSEQETSIYILFFSYQQQQPRLKERNKQINKCNECVRTLVTSHTTYLLFCEVCTAMKKKITETRSFYDFSAELF